MSSPRACNTGGKSRNTPPRAGGKVSYLVDWVTAVFPDLAADDLVRLALSLTRCALRGFTERPRGLLGYTASWASVRKGAMVAVGGNRGTSMLQFTGEGCAMVADWHEFRAALEAHGAWLTRLDVAADDHAGEFSIEYAVDQVRAGAFTMRGRPPVISTAGDWLLGDGRGRTLYVGARKNGKFLRVYEKGQQLGDPLSPWVRWEVQLGNRDRVIPLAAMVDPRAAFAGAYPALQFAGNGFRIPTLRERERISRAKLEKHAQLAYGGLLTLMKGEGKDAADELGRPVPPRRLSFPTVEEREREANLALHLHAAECELESWMQVPEGTPHQHGGGER